MADNVVMNAGSGGDTLAADDIGTVKYPRTKLTLGADGVNDGDVSASNPMPVKAQGQAAENAAASGNPLLVGGRYDTVARTLNDGDAGAIALDADGAVQVSDGGNSLTVDGTVTANAGTNLNTSALALESGGNLATIAGAVSGTEMQVDIVAALPAGTNTIGKLAANSGVDIGDVDVTSLPSGSQAAVTAKTADYDTGAGTDTVPMQGIALPASGGAVAGGTSTNPVRVDPTGSTTQPVSDGGGSLTVDGTVTANAGTNLNTSALALESGGNLATIAGAVAGTEMQCDIVAPLPAGTNAIGKLAANSGVDIGDVDVTSMPARDRLTDNMGVALQTDALLNDTTALTPKFKVISASSSGNNTLVTAVTGKKIRVLSLALISRGVVSVFFRNGTAGVGIFANTSNPVPLDNTGATGAGGLVLGFNPLGWFETNAGSALTLNLSAAVGVCGSLVYVEV